MSGSFEEEARRLARLPRAERFDELIDFPVHYTFKVIGRGRAFTAEVQGLLRARGHDRVIVVERPSSEGRFVSVTFELDVDDARTLDGIYSELEALPGVAVIL